MSALTQTVTKVVLREASSVLERVCEQIVAQLSLHGLLNKARLCQGTKRGSEVEAALNRLTSLGVMCSVNLQVDYNTITYYFLREYADIVAIIFKRRAQAIADYQALRKPPAYSDPYVTQHEVPTPQDEALRAVPLTDFVARELAGNA